MIGAIIGDIVGSRFERANHKSTEFELFTKKCHFTDDTVMTLAIAKALLESNGDLSALSGNAVKCMQELGRKYPNCGYGQKFYLWLNRKNPQPYQSYGNGAAMRVSPVAYAARFQTECIVLSNEVTKVSHNHPEGMWGARAAAVATWAALHKMPKPEIQKLIETEYHMGLSRLAAKCRACPDVDICDHKEMEAFGVLPLPEPVAQSSETEYRNIENLWDNPKFLIGTGPNLGGLVKAGGEINIDVEGLVRAIAREIQLPERVLRGDSYIG